MSDHFGNIPIQPPESSPPEKKKKLPQKPSGKKASRAPVAKTSKDQRRSSINTSGWIIAAVAIFAFLALYSALGFFGVPYYVAKVLPEHFQEKTGMVLEPTTVSFNPFTFRFATGSVRILSKPDASFMALHSLVADVTPFALLRLNMVCDSISINELNLNIARELDGSYNFQQILGTEEGSTLSEILDFSDLPFSFSLNNISIANSKVIFNDVPTGKVHTIEKIQLELPSFSNIPFQKDQYIRPHFSAVVNGSPIELTGQTSLAEADGEDQATKLSMDIHDLDLTLYSGYFPFSLPMEVKKGTANGAIDLFFGPQTTSGDKFSIGFQLQLSEAELFKENKSITIIVPTARLNGTLQPISRTVHFSKITVNDPTIDSFGKFLSGNIKQPKKQEGQDSPAGNSSTEVAPYNLMIDQLLVDNGIVRLFTEKKDQKPASTWNAIQLSVKNYRSDPENQAAQNDGSFSLSGEKDGTSAYFSWEGSFSSTGSLTGNLTLQNMDSNNLLRNIGSDHPFKLKGVADLKGQLMLSLNKDKASPLSYKLVDAALIIENFALMDKEESILTAPIVNFASLSLVDKAINFGNVRLEKSVAQFTYGRLPNIFTAFNSNTYRLQGIDFEGKVTFSSPKKSEQHLTLTNVSLKADELAGSRKKPNNLSISAQTETGGIFKAQGSAALAPFSASVKTGFRELPAKNVFPFFSNSSLLRELRGNLSGKGQLELPVKSFAGELQLTNFHNKESKEATFSWQKAVFQNVKYTAKPFHLGITSANIDQALLSWKITKADNGPMSYLTDFFQKYLPSANRKSPGKSPTTFSPVDIREISFSNTKISIHDQRLIPDWQAEVIGFAGKIQDIQSTTGTNKTTFSFTGKLDDTPFTINGAIDPFAKENNGTFRFSMENYPLASFDKQLAAKTDVDISNGKFKLALDCIWQDRQYKRSGNFTFIDVKPIDVTSDSALPLALLMGDDNTLQLHFDFNETEPVAKTTLFNEMLTSFQRQVVKGSVSPLLLATGDFTDLIGNEFVEFRPGEFMLADKSRDVLVRYGALLEAHPHVGLVLSGGIDPKIDREAMNQQLTALEQQRVEKENQRLFNIWQEKKDLYEKNLEEQQQKVEPGGKIVEQDIPSDVLVGFKPIRPEPIVVSKAMLLELGQKRINILYEHFTTQLGLQPGRISVATPEDLPGKSESPTSGVSITLQAISR
jgi:hypothetical protein